METLSIDDRLKRIRQFAEQCRYQCRDGDEVYDVFENQDNHAYYSDAVYSVVPQEYLDDEPFRLACHIIGTLFDVEVLKDW
jgi:hypothetical protein